MYKKDVIQHFGNVPEVAKVLNCTTNNVYMWGELVPKGVALELDWLTRNWKNPLRYDPRLYTNYNASKGRPRKAS